MEKLALLILLSSGHQDNWDNFNKGRGDYADVPETHYVFCRVRRYPTDRTDCTERPWRKPQ